MKNFLMIIFFLFNIAYAQSNLDISHSQFRFVDNDTSLRICSHYDDFEETLTYRHYVPIVKEGKSIQLAKAGVDIILYENAEIFISIENDVPVLILEMAKKEDEWIFFNKTIFLGDSSKLIINFEENQLLKKVLKDGVMEKGNLVLNESQINLLYEIVLSETVKLRFSGERNVDIVFVEYQKTILKDMIEFYYGLKDKK